VSTYPTIEDCPDVPHALPVAVTVAISPNYVISGRIDGRVNLQAITDDMTVGDMLFAPFQIFDTPRAAAIAVESGCTELALA